MAAEKGEKGAIGAEKGKGAAAEEGKGAMATAEKEVAGGGKLITLTSADGKAFQVSEAAARLSTLLRGMIKDGRSDDGVPLPSSISGGTLEKVVEYCNKHAEAAADTDYDPDDGAAIGIRSDRAAAKKELEEWDRELIDGLSEDLDALFDVIGAADYLDIDGLLNATCRKVADMMMGKNPDEIRETFNIEDDFTKEEKEEMRREFAWAYPIFKPSVDVGHHDDEDDEDEGYDDDEDEGYDDDDDEGYDDDDD
ncbi:hypothetical protein ACP70R_004777 [Stipagrostis hirtigluma subsp. patula]